MGKLLKKITKRRLATVLCVVLYFSVIAVTMRVNNIKTIKELFCNSEALEKVCYVVELLTGLCLILSAVIAVWQYYLSTRCEINKQATESVQKSIDLAEYYRTHILDKYEIIYYVYNDVGVLDIINSINPEKMKEFDETELRKVLSLTQIAEIDRLKKSKELIKVLMKVEMVFGIDLGIREHVQIVKGDEDVDVEINTPAIMRRFGNCIVSEVLNCLEYFAMHFEHNTADETVVYQSLHQTYLELVQMLYCEISMKNRSGHKKYYTNVIGLYNKWFATYEQKQLELAQRGREGVVKGTVVDKLG